MADELLIQFVVPGTPAQVQAAWRSDPPAALRDEHFVVVDEAYNSITFERTYLDWPMKVLLVTTLGLAWLLIGFMRSSFRVSARFDAEGAMATRVTLSGKAHPQARVKLVELAERHHADGWRSSPSSMSTAA